MKIIKTLVWIGLALIATAAGPVYAQTLALTGNDLTIEDLVVVARTSDSTVTVADTAATRVVEGFEVVQQAVLQGAPVYGLNVGVGWNKDQPVFREVNGERILDEALLEASRDFNAASMRAHAGGVGPELSLEVVRAGMLIRLNTMLSGVTGVQPGVMRMYKTFLNEGVTPVVPSMGSVGQADITLAAHIGLAMMGEGRVYYGGEQRSAGEVLEELGVTPIAPVGKDFLSILSTNALTTGRAALLAADVRDYLEVAPAVFALALEGWNGNIAPYLPETTSLRPYPGMVEAALRVRDTLDGSYLWQPHEERALQDPLSYRTMGYTLGDAIRYSEELYEALSQQLNWSDDNPAVVLGNWSPAMPDSQQVAGYRVEGDTAGAIYPTANFEMLPIASRIEGVSQSLARLSLSIAMQTIRYENPGLSHLPRFLAAPENSNHAFGAMQKPLVALYAENVHLAMPVSSITLAMAGNVEDFASNAPLAADNLQRILDNMYHMSSVQMLHASQAIDLRGDVTLGDGTQALYDAYREKVPFVEQDRAYASDFAAGLGVLADFSRTQGQ